MSRPWRPSRTASPGSPGTRRCTAWAGGGGRRGRPRGRGGAGGARPGRGPGGCRGRHRAAGGHLGGAAPRGRDARRRRATGSSTRGWPPTTRCREPGGVPGAAQLVPAPQAGDQPAAGPRHRRPGPAVPADLQAGLGPARRRRRGRRVAAAGRGARGRGGARAHDHRPAPCCSPTGCRRGAAGTTRCAWSSTAASTTPRSLDAMVRQEREIRAAEFCTLAEVHDRAADFTARRIDSALRTLPRAAGRRTPSPARAEQPGASATARSAPLHAGRQCLDRSMGTYVYDFAEGDKDQKDLLGGKGANLAEMTNLGLPVPPGFTITTEACRAYLEQGSEPDGLGERGHRAPRGPREGDGATARRPRRPAAGQRALGREVLDARDDGDGPQHRPQRRVGAAAWPGPERRRAVRAWTPTAGCCRCSAAPCSASSPSTSPRPSTTLKQARGTDRRPRPRRRRPARAGRRRSRRSSASTPAASSRRTRASSSTSPSAPSSTRGTPTAPGSTAGRSGSPRTSAPRSTSRRWCSATSGMDSGSGVAFTRDPASGAQGVYGDYLQNAQGEDVVAGIRNTVSLADFGRGRPGVLRRAAGRSWPGSSATTATCATSSSPSSAASSGCCRPGSASARRRRRSGSRCTWSTRA